MDTNDRRRLAYRLLIHDPSISERKKQELCRRYPCDTDAEEAAFIADVLIFGMTRPFQAYDIRKPNPIGAAALSPIARDYILGNEAPKPCAHFCGRDEELKTLHETLTSHRVVFLEGVAGIGKSEIAKAYAREHKKEYTNIIYLMYSGDLRRDIADMYFADDLPSDTDESRFNRHDRFLRTLKEDSLLIIDNFNVESIKEHFPIFLHHYRCRIILTTRNHWPGQRSLHIDRIANDEALFQLMVRFYPDAEKKRPFFLKLMMLLQYHTLIIELAARLFGSGMLTPEAAGALFCFHGMKISSKDKIRILKDGKPIQNTFAEHIHALFGLYRLSEAQQNILRCMVLIPATGIPMRLLGVWMGFNDLNDVHELIDLGLLKQMPGNRVALQNTLRQVCRAEMETSVSRCQMLLEPLRMTCQLHGVDVPEYQLIYQIVNLTIRYAQKDEMTYYLLLLEDAFQYLEKYRFRSGMEKIIQEISVQIHKGNGTPKDRAILLDCKAQMADDPQESLKLMQQALALLPDITEENALLVSNLNANIGGTYRMMGQYDLAKQHMETAMHILEQHHLTEYHDCYAQIINYAMLLGDMGEPEKGLIGLKKAEQFIQDVNPHSYDHGILLQAKGTLQECSSHYISAKQIKAVLLEDIRRHASLAAEDKEKYIAHLMRLSDREWDGEKASITKEAEQCQRRISELDILLKRLYEDNVFGRISGERFASLSADYESESRKLKDRYNEIQVLLANYARQSHDAKEFAALVEQYTDITELTEELLHTLIEKVVVHEKEIIDGETMMRIDIYYRFIGKVGSEDGESLKTQKTRQGSHKLAPGA